MTSSQPVITPNALNFTPDNKRCYAYGGTNASSATSTTYLLFDTNSEYIIGEFQINAGLDDDTPSESVAPTTLLIKFNDIGIAIIGTGGGSTDRRPSSTIQRLIIPPFTKVECIVDSLDAADKYNSVTFTGEAVGMIKTDFQ